MRTLLAAGAPWNAIDRAGKCAGDLALEAGSKDAADAILEAGANPTVRQMYGACYSNASHIHLRTSDLHAHGAEDMTISLSFVLLCALQASGRSKRLLPSSCERLPCFSTPLFRFAVLHRSARRVHTRGDGLPCFLAHNRVCAAAQECAPS